MKKNYQKNKLLLPLSFLALIILSGSYFALEIARVDPLTYSIKLFQKAARYSPEDSAFAKSNFEWLANVGLTKRDFIKSSLITTTLTGTVIEASLTEGKLPISAKYYYIGEPGFYQYGSTITLKTDSGNERTFYFSPQRTKAMKITKGNSNIKLEDIKPGSKVDITETVDLAIPNVNDANLVSISLKVI